MSYSDLWLLRAPFVIFWVLGSWPFTHNHRSCGVNGSKCLVKVKVGLIQFYISPPKTDMDHNVVVSDYAIRSCAERIARIFRSRKSPWTLARAKIEQHRYKIEPMSDPKKSKQPICICWLFRYDNLLFHDVYKIKVNYVQFVLLYKTNFINNELLGTLNFIQLSKKISNGLCLYCIRIFSNEAHLCLEAIFQQLEKKLRFENRSCLGQ